MQKHRGFPGRLPGTDYQFVIRRANAGGATKIVRRERYRDRSPADRAADLGFMQALWDHFGDRPFVRGNLDAGRLSWLIGREVVWASEPADPASYDQLLRIDVRRAQASFPQVFAARGAGGGGEAGWDDDGGDDDGGDGDGGGGDGGGGDGGGGE